jgi:hypothetical protein
MGDDLKLKGTASGDDISLLLKDLASQLKDMVEQRATDQPSWRASFSAQMPWSSAPALHHLPPSASVTHA